MRPEIWGNHAWILLHSITLDYPENPTNNDKTNILNFINSLQYVLPCEKCRVHFQNHLKNNNLTNDILSSKKKFINWMIDIHNQVNKSTGKKILSHDEALNKILDLYNNDKSIYSGYYIILCFIIIVFLSLLIYFIFNHQ